MLEQALPLEPDDNLREQLEVKKLRELRELTKLHALEGLSGIEELRALAQQSGVDLLSLNESEAEEPEEEEDFSRRNAGLLELTDEQVVQLAHDGNSDA